MELFYRISDSGYPKVKPDYVNNRNCLENFIQKFGTQNLHLIADNVCDETFDWLCTFGCSLERTEFGHGAGSFNFALDKALQLPPESLVYFVEDDYIHRAGAAEVILEGFKLGPDYLSLYDHPDKYMKPEDGGNPYVKNGGEQSKVFVSKSCHWKLTNSTTMTFASRVHTLVEDEQELREFTSETYPYDFQMFLALRQKGRSLITPVPGFATHGESALLAPIIDWRAVMLEKSRGLL